MRFKLSVLCKCFPTNSAVEWMDPWADRTDGNDLLTKANPRCPLSVSPFVLQVQLLPHHLQRQYKREPGTCVLTRMFPWSQEGGGRLPFAPFNLGPQSCNHYLSLPYTPQQDPTLVLHYTHLIKYVMFQAESLLHKHKQMKTLYPGRLPLFCSIPAQDPVAPLCPCCCSLV